MAASSAPASAEPLDPQPGHHGVDKVTPATLLIAMGIIYGDIGTSPLYVMKAIVGQQPISQALVLGGLSAVFWTLTLQTTIKYVWLMLRADNKGEGGVFSLYALIRNQLVAKGKRQPGTLLIVAALLGGAALLADGVITPTISVTSAIEGLHKIDPNLPILPIVAGILSLLFFIQQFGTGAIGRLFGPVMLVWFTTLLVLGLTQVLGSPQVLLHMLNPVNAVRFVIVAPEGFWLLGAVFLCTTGAEALYSDMGHVGKKNVRLSWIYVKTALLINYAGQAAWIVNQGDGSRLGNLNPFYELVPQPVLGLGIALATLAAIIASQALITGSFTLITEAIRLNIWPKARIVYPTVQRGQMFVPSINVLLWVGCLVVLWFFEAESENMEAAYGLTITIAMIMTSLLFLWHLRLKRAPWVALVAFVLVYAPLEGAFFAANLIKFMHGAWISLVICGALFAVMWASYHGRRIKNRLVRYENLHDHLDAICALQADQQVPKYATHLVYLTLSQDPARMEQTIVHSIFRRQPKRADVYWFVHVNVVDEPHTQQYWVRHLVPGQVIWITFNLGFRVEQRVSLLFREVVQKLVERGEVDIQSRYASLLERNVIGDFKFVVMHKFLSTVNDLDTRTDLIMRGYFLVNRLGESEEKAFGLESSNVEVESVPLIVSPAELDLEEVSPPTDQDED